MTDTEGAESFEDHLKGQQAAVPPMLYVPTTGGGDGRFAEVEMRNTKDGRTALLAYTALDRLLSCCGSQQPWALLQTDRLHELEQTQPYEVIYLDMALPEELRREASDDADVADDEAEAEARRG